MGTLSQVKAIAKARPEPGLQLIEIDEPSVRPGCVKVRIQKGSVCGTDLHIYNWDEWSSKRIHPPRVVGHEFCGIVTELGEGVTGHEVGDFIASESHIVCGKCKQCLAGQGHVCVNTTILGVDVDGGFGAFAVIPAQNARPVPPSVPREVASMLDALGNAVHTVMATEIEGRSVLITGMGPIGMFAVAICRALGADKIYATEISGYRIEMAHRLGATDVFNPMVENVDERLCKVEPKGVDITLEMSGHPSALNLAVGHTRPGGHVSLLGVYPDSSERVDFNAIIFKGLTVHGIVGRQLWRTWEQMSWLLEEKHLDVMPIITHQMPYTEYDTVFQTMKEGKAGKIVLDFTA